MGLEMDRKTLERIETYVLSEAREIDREADHKDWFPCGFAWVTISGRSSLARYLRKHHGSPRGFIGWYKNHSEGGYSLVFRYPHHDAYTCQSMRFAKAIADLLAETLRDYGVEAYSACRMD